MRESSAKVTETQKYANINLWRHPIDDGSVGGHRGIWANGDGAKIFICISSILATKHARGEAISQRLSLKRAHSVHL